MTRSIRLVDPPDARIAGDLHRLCSHAHCRRRPSWAQAPAVRPGRVSRQTPSIAGELVIEPPTLINLGFEWFIQGDANRNATVDVSFRKKGRDAWKPALPLLRLQGERIYAESRVDSIAPNMFAGSILDLEPDTAYEVRLAMTDPDGVQGETQHGRDRAHAARAAAVCRRPRVSRLSARLQPARRSSRRSKG